MIPKISICIAARDEEAKIESALESARACKRAGWCDEVLVFDSGSTDRTVQIARRLADRVEFHEWENYAASKRRMTQAARNEWVFILDADERMTEELIAEIGALKEEDFARHPVMSMRRRNHVLGRAVRAWDPDWQNRLIDRRRVHWPERAVHDERKATQGTELRLRGRLLHNADIDQWTDYFDGERYQKRTELLAAELLKRGKRVGWLGLLLRPAGAFVKFYVFKGGFLDGAFGVMIAQKAAFSVQLKYARLWHLQREADKAR
jgi:glycosyltransferase involved in cell wall biosynthesis